MESDAVVRRSASGRHAGPRLGLCCAFIDSQLVARASCRELEYQAEVATLVGAEQLTIHGGGAQGGKEQALGRLVRALGRLSVRARQLVVLENDDSVYTVQDLLPVCHAEGIPPVYDVHHHRCHPDELRLEDATQAAMKTWQGREPWFHVSSPAQAGPAETRGPTTNASGGATCRRRGASCASRSTWRPRARARRVAAPAGPAGWGPGARRRTGADGRAARRSPLK